VVAVNRTGDEDAETHSFACIVEEVINKAINDLHAEMDEFMSMDENETFH
jgi:hypothetical protein